MRKPLINIGKILIKGITATLLLVLLPFSSQAQESNLGNWLIYIGSKKVNEKLNIHHEVQYRNYNTIGDLEQLLLRTGVGYNLTDNSNLLLGYGFIRSENYVPNTDIKNRVDEHRIFQQFITKAKVGKIGMQHRYRFEQRFVNDDFKMRFRYFLGLSLPLKFQENDKFYLSGYNEIFLNTDGVIFDRNRVYGGLGYRISKALRLELGYMNQYFTAAQRDQINILLFGNF